MTEALASALVRNLRRTVSYCRLYGADHRLTTESAADTAGASVTLIGSRAGVLVAISDETLFVDGAALGLTSLQYNGFLRDVAGAGVETLVMTGAVDPGEIISLAKLISGLIDEPANGDTILVNQISIGRGDLTESPTTRLRQSYTHSLTALREVGGALNAGEDISLTATASIVRGLLSDGLAHPTASLLLATVKSHHEYTFYHSINTSILALGVARLLGLPEEQQLLLGMGAMLHDVGKIGVSTAVLQHPGRLDRDQWAEIRRHPQVGAEAILAAAAPGEEVAAVVAFEHHARFDGSGYPRLVYHDGSHSHPPHHPLHFFSRLVAVADTYDAITTRRSYRRAEPPSRALHVLLAEAGTSYDPDFVLAFASLVGIHPPGSFLRLVSGHVVMVTQPSEEANGAPAAVLVRDAVGQTVEQPEPFTYSAGDIAEHLSPAGVGVSPTEILERMGTESGLV